MTLGRPFFTGVAVLLLAAHAVASPAHGAFLRRQATPYPVNATASASSAPNTAAPVAAGQTALAAPTVLTISGTPTTCVLSSILPTTITDVTTIAGTPTPYLTFSLPNTIECSCGEVQAGVGTTTGADGTPTYTCEFGFTSNPVVGTAAPWQSVSCDFGSLTDITNNPWDQWNDSQADAAWSDMASAWAADTKGENLTNFISNFFKGPPNPSCDIIDNPNCDTTINCGQGGEANAAINSPAGYVIYNSMVSIHQQLDNLYAGMQSALTDVIGLVGQFTSTFSPIDQVISEEESEKHALDGIQLGVAFLSAFTFNSYLKGVPFFKSNGNALGIGKDSTNAAITSGMNFIKDALQSESALPVQNNISSHVVDIVTAWVNNMQGMATGLFNDIDTLHAVVVDGQTFGTPETTGPIQISPLVQKVIFANVLPMAWNLGPTVQSPVILVSDNVETDGSGCTGFNPSKGTGVQEKFETGSSDVWDANRFCVGNLAFWLVGANASPSNPCAYESSCPGCQPTCESYLPKFQTLGGLSTLDGKNWGGLLSSDIFNNAYNTWLANTETNDGPPLDTTQPAAIEQIAGGDITQALGLVAIPICSFAQALNTLYEDQGNSNGSNTWPCPPP